MICRPSATLVRVCCVLAALGLLVGMASTRVHAQDDHLRVIKQPPAYQLMRSSVERALLEEVPARQAFDWWSNITGISLVVNGRQLELIGVDGDAPINIGLHQVTAAQLLGLMLDQITIDEPLLYETTEHYVLVTTRDAALRNTVVRVYPIDDLLMEVPDFDDAPTFDLQSALSNTNSGGGAAGGGGSDNIFGDFENDEEPRKTRTERGEEIAQLIRDTIEPDIWIENGGLYASIKYFDGKLIVNAPRFVQGHVGNPISGKLTPRADRFASGTTKPKVVAVPAEAPSDDAQATNADTE